MEPGREPRRGLAVTLDAGWAEGARSTPGRGPTSSSPSTPPPCSTHSKPLQAKIVGKKLPLCTMPYAVKNVPHETPQSRSNKIPLKCKT